jgi:hypothetical protein
MGSLVRQYGWQSEKATQLIAQTATKCFRGNKQIGMDNKEM